MFGIEERRRCVAVVALTHLPAVPERPSSSARRRRGHVTQRSAGPTSCRSVPTAWWTLEAVRVEQIVVVVVVVVVVAVVVVVVVVVVTS